MFRLHSDLTRACLARLLAPTTFLLASAMVLTGCVTSTDVSPGRADPTASAGAEPKEPATPALVEVDEAVGFTVTEVVAIGSSVRADYHEALRLLAVEDFEGGIRLLTQVTEKSPRVTGPFVDLGIAQSRFGALAEAQTSLSRALALTPDHPVAHNELGIVYRKLGQFSAARQSYESALAVHPGFHFARRNLAVLCDLYLADLQCALDNYEIYRTAVPEDREVEIWVGDLRHRVAANQ